MIVRRARGQSLTILGDLAQRTAEAGVSHAGTPCCGEAGVDAHRRRASCSSATACPTTSCASPARCCRPGRAAPRGVRARAVAGRWRCETDDLGAAAARARRAAGRGRRQRRRRRAARAAWTRSRAALGRRSPTRPTARRSGRASTCSTCTWSRAWSSTRSSCVEPAAILRERPDGGVGGLYTALTRSTRALAIVHAEPLPGRPPRGESLRTELDRNRA